MISDSNLLFWATLYVQYYVFCTSCTRCSDVIDVIIITRRHVGGISNVNTNFVKIRKYENSHAKVIRIRFIFHTTRSASKRKVYDVTSLH